MHSMRMREKPGSPACPAWRGNALPPSEPTPARGCRRGLGCEPRGWGGGSGVGVSGSYVCGSGSVAVVVVVAVCGGSESGGGGGDP
jgi:hypothetical protein